MSETTFGDLSGSRRNNFNFLRLFLACAVIFSHSYPISGHVYSEPLGIWTHWQTDAGKLAVDFFFVISGFLITNSWLHSRTPSDYLKKRALRIYPGYIAALLIGAFVVAPLGGATMSTYLHHRDIYQFIYRPLLFRGMYTVQGVFLNSPCKGTINGSLWTIQYEIFCYILVALAGALGAFRKKTIVLVAFLAALGISNYWHEPFHLSWFGDLRELPRLVTFYLAGVTFYLYRDRIKHSMVLFGISCLALAATVHGLLGLTLPIFGTYALLYLALSPQIRLHDVGRSRDISYGVYLYAYPTQQILFSYCPWASTPMHLFVLALPFTAILALMSWHLIEAPFLALKPREISPSSEVAASPASAGAQQGEQAEQRKALV